MKKIGILGGSFDPIHNQHIAIAKATYKQLKLDQVWILPTKLNPLKNNISATTEQRLTMIKLASKGLSWLKLNQYELQTKAKVNYTIDTIKAFQKSYPEYQFYFIIGADNLISLNKWKDITQLIDLVKFVVINRPDYQPSISLMEKYHCQSLTITNSSDISSSKIRTGETIEDLNPPVIDYINDNLIYCHERLKFHLDGERVQHCLNVGKAAEKLAIKHHVNPKKALIAGTFHDIAKQWPKEKLINYLQQYAPKQLTTPFNLYHGYVGALYLQHHLKYHDREIISAIFNHTSGAIKMSKLDLIVLLADKISPERKYRGVKQLRKLAFKNLSLAFSKYLEILKTSLDERQIPLNPEFNLIYQKWHKKQVK
ncbi:MAG: nicotinate-nucleotide adenylyltransferase [Spiroplasma sp.]|nr:nicotinate-nucleotide adenylyltransferase [Spiroplasma sp.]